MRRFLCRPVQLVHKIIAHLPAHPSTFSWISQLEAGDLIMIEMPCIWVPRDRLGCRRKRTGSSIHLPLVWCAANRVPHANVPYRGPGSRCDSLQRFRLHLVVSHGQHVGARAATSPGKTQKATYDQTPIAERWKGPRAAASDRLTPADVDTFPFVSQARAPCHAFMEANAEQQLRFSTLPLRRHPPTNCELLSNVLR
jgi:hypothetical protein